MVTTTLYSLADAKRDHPNWFDAGAVSFFNGRDHEHYSTEGSLYLVHSIQFDEDMPRQYKIARFTAEVSDDIGPIGGWTELATAKRIATSCHLAENLERLRTRLERSHYQACQACQDARRPHPAWATFELQHAVEDDIVEIVRWVPLCPEHLAEAVSA